MSLAQPQTGRMLARTGMAVVLAGALLRAVTSTNPFPYWDLSPLMYPPQMSGIGPAQSMLIDVLIILGAAAALLGESLWGRRLRIIPLLLAAVGAAGVILHGWILPDRDLSNQWIGSTWFAAIAGALAAAHACRDQRTRRLVAATVLGFVLLLTLKGAQQYYLEHARTVAQYQANRAEFLNAQGWTAGSSNALAYERRLDQPDATGWFGLSNVYASFAAMGFAGFLGALWTIARRHARAPVQWLAPAVGLLASGAALWMAQSKGGVIAAALGVVATAAIAVLGRSQVRRSRLGRARAVGGILALGVVAAGIGLIIARGLVGERIGGASLLFRWFYMVGAARVSAAHPIFGVGPAGFQEAYLTARPPLGVEEVTSPHSILLDYISTLGVFGLAWIALWLSWVWRIGADAARLLPIQGDAGDDERSHPERWEYRALALIAAAAAIGGTWLEIPATTVDKSLVWLIGLAAWWGVGWMTLRRLSFAATGLALAGMALVLAAHAQVDVTPVQAGSAALFMLLIGAAAAGTQPHVGTAPRAASPAPDARGQGRKIGRLTGARGWTAAGVLVLVAAALAIWGIRPAARWQGYLHEAANVLGPVQQARMDLSQAEKAPDPIAAAARVASDLGRFLGRPVPATADGLTKSMQELEIGLIPQAVAGLSKAGGVYPRQWKVRRSASGLLLERASNLLAQGRTSEANADLDKAEAVLGVCWADDGPKPGAAASELRAYALVFESRNSLTGDRASLDRAIDVLGAVMVRDPLNLEVAYRLFELCRRADRDEAARRWARESMRLNGLKRLDAAVHGLSSEQMSRIRGYLSRP